MQYFHPDDSRDRCRCGADRQTDDPAIPACASPYHCPALLAERQAIQDAIARTANADKFYDGNVRLSVGVRCF